MNKNLKTTLKVSLATVIGASVLCGVTEVVAKRGFGIELPVQGQVDFIKSHIGWNLTFAIIVAEAVLLMPALEEILFRWLLWKWPLSLAHKWDGGGRVARTLLAVAMSSLFAFAHYIDYALLVTNRKFALTGWNGAFVALFFFGMIQSWLYKRTGKLWCPIVNHVLFNTVNIIGLLIVMIIGSLIDSPLEI